MDNYNVNEAFLENLSLGLSSSLGKKVIELLNNVVKLSIFLKKSYQEFKMSGRYNILYFQIGSCNINNVLIARVTKMPPCDLLAITAWEQRYSTQLPEVKEPKEFSLKAQFLFHIK